MINIFLGYNERIDFGIELEIKYLYRLESREEYCSVGCDAV
jgi:hypothetical protein